MKRNYLIRAAMTGAILSLSVTGTMAQGDKRAPGPEPRFALNLSINVRDPQKLMVTVSNPAGEKLSVDVYSAEEDRLLSRVANGLEYRGCFDFSTAVDGDYRVEVCGRSGKIVRSCTIQTGGDNHRELQIE